MPDEIAATSLQEDLDAMNSRRRALGRLVVTAAGNATPICSALRGSRRSEASSSSRSCEALASGADSFMAAPASASSRWDMSFAPSGTLRYLILMPPER